jgi:transposase
MAEIEGQPGQPEPRRSFTEEFKREAVRLATERGNVSAVARDLGIHESVLNRWKRRLQEEADHPGAGTRSFPGRGNARDEEMTKLQRENARLKQENEILKKAVLPCWHGVGIFTSRP